MGGSRSHLYEDSDDESDTLATDSIHSMEKISLRDHDQEGNYRHRRAISQRHNSLLNWLRWGIVVALQAIIITLLCVRPKAEMRDLLDTETGADINGLYPTVEHEYKRLKFEEDLYMPNMTSLNDRDEVRRRWDKLLPRGSGSVAISDYKKHPLLGEPIADDPIRTGPLFEASWTHALHCVGDADPQVFASVTNLISSTTQSINIISLF
ncbi:MAG: hypothetical protein Q9157_000981 [Trypethelium eluteriae]